MMISEDHDYIDITGRKYRYRIQRAGKNRIRVTCTMGEEPAPPSEILTPGAAELLKKGSLSSSADLSQDQETICFSNGRLTVQIDPETERFTWSDTGRNRLLFRENGKELFRQDVIRYTTDGEEPVIERVRTVDGERNFIKNLKPKTVRQAYRAKLFLCFEEEERLFGLGQGEDGAYDKRHQNTYLYQHNMRIPMPVLTSDRGYGIFFDCGSLMTFEDDAAGSYFLLDTVKQLDYYVICGSRMDDIVSGYRDLTGRAALLPKWAFGYVQSKERYKSAEELRDVVKRYREEEIPLDCVVQDWYTWKEGRWGEKILDPDRYGDMEKYAGEIHDMHAHLMVSVWPNMNSNTEDHAQFLKEGMLLNDLATYDAFDEKARKIYWNQAKKGLFDRGFDSWWCDSTEPFSGPDWGGEIKKEPWERYSAVGGEHKHFLDPEQANLYAVAHARGIYENQRADAPDRRVLNLTRSGYSSSQRYGAVLWSGDIAARWDVMKKQIAEGLSMAASGYPWWTLDIGAFFTVRERTENRGCECHDDPTPKWFWQGDYEEGVKDKGYQELYTRWLEFGCFLPMFRSHGTDTPREIWNFGEKGTPVYDAIAYYIRLRYRLMPYIYSLAGSVTLEHGTMMRGLIFDFPEDPRAAAIDTEFMFGPALLVCPVTEPMYYDRESRELDREKKWSCYLPEGSSWYDFRDNKKYEGGQEVTVDAPLDRMPVFVKAGSILPTVEGLQYACQESTGKIILYVYPGADADFTMYEDAGEGYGYEKGEFTLTHLHWDDGKRQLTVNGAQDTDGRFDIVVILESEGLHDSEK